MMNLKTGYERLDEATDGLQLGKIYVIAGRNRIGKTAFALNIASKISVKDSYRTLFLTSKRSDITDNIVFNELLMINGRIDRKEIQSGKFIQFEKGTQTIKQIKDAPIDLIDVSDAITLEDIGTRCTDYENLSLIVIDDVFLLTKKIFKGSNRIKNKYVEIMEYLKRLSQSLQVPIIIVCDIRKRIDNKKNRNPYRNDLVKNKIISEYVDVIITIFRDEFYNKKRRRRESQNLEFILNGMMIRWK